MNDKNLNPRAPEGDLGDLTEEEASALVSLLRSAYPNPPPGMTERIMERIRDEAGESAKLLPAADSRARDGKRNNRGTWIRWSALAASILLVGTIGLSILPNLTRGLGVSKMQSADSAAPESREAASDSSSLTNLTTEEAEEAIAEEAAEVEDEAEEFALELEADECPPAEMPAPEPEPMPAPASASADPARAAEEKSAVTASGASEEGAQDDNTAFDGVFAAPAAPESALSYAAEAEAEAYDTVSDFAADFDAPDEDAPEEGLLSMKLYTLNGASGISAAEGEIPMMTSGAQNTASADAEPRSMLTYYYVRTACAHADAFRNSYHDIPEVLIAKVGPELYGAWATKVQNEDLCGVNILSFAVRFGLTAEDIYATGDTWYFLDLPDGIPLTEENAGAVEQYYLDGGDPGKMIPRMTVYLLKTAMIREAGMDAYLAWRADADRSLVSWTVREGAEALGLDSETMDRLYEEAVEKVAAEYGGEYLPARDEAFAG